jgi:hypothetical protein
VYTDVHTDPHHHANADRNLYTHAVINPYAFCNVHTDADAYCYTHAIINVYTFGNLHADQHPRLRSPGRPGHLPG